MFFETVLPTIEKNAFCRDIFSKQHFFSKGSHTLNSKITFEDIDDYLTAWNGFLNTFVVASIDGNRINISADDNNPLTQKQQIESLYRRGATLKISSFETRHPLVARICRDLELTFGGRAFGKAFITAPGRAGYDIHFDAYDTFIVQLDGSKHWKVYAASEPMPSEEVARQLSAEEAGAPIAEYVLEPGDLLYMPAGFPHSARCTQAHSLHITIGFSPWRANRIIEYLVTSLAIRNETIRRHILPAVADPDAVAKLKIALMDVASALESMDAGELLQAYSHASSANMPAIVDSSIRNASYEPQISPSAKFQFDRTGMHSFSVNSDEKTAYVRMGCAVPSTHKLYAQPPRIELPAYVESDLNSIFSKTEPFSLNEVSGALDEESRLLLLTELSKNGIVKIVTPA